MICGVYVLGSANQKPNLERRDQQVRLGDVASSAELGHMSDLYCGDRLSLPLRKSKGVIAAVTSTLFDAKITG
jgi:hypothetical protein